VSNCLDLEILTELVDIMGDDMEMLMNSYIEDSETKLELFVKMDLRDGQEDIFRMAHSLKGSSRNVGVKLFADYCELIENKAREGELMEDDFSSDHLYELFNNAKSELLTRFT